MNCLFFYIQIQRNSIQQESGRNSMRLCLDGTNITSLPDITGVTYLKCNNNRLKVLSDMPIMEELYCRNNKLRLLPHLPNVKNYRVLQIELNIYHTFHF